jgi:DNA-binding NarL/FixJ family response regulator
LADDHTIVLQGLSRFLREQEGMEVVGQAKGGPSIVELARELAPDIIMDISVPGLNGIEAPRRIHAEDPRIKIIGLSMHVAKRYVQEMHEAGARGYLLKDCDFDKLLAAIQAVAAGGTCFAGEFRDGVGQTAGPPRATDRAGGAVADPLHVRTHRHRAWSNVIRCAPGGCGKRQRSS